MDDWTIVYDEWNEDHEPLREALCTLGNGYFATRGAAEEASNEDSHYPGTYLAGGYNRLTTEISGRDIVNEDLVNWPNWLKLTFQIEDGPWFRIGETKILMYQQRLDMKRGILERDMRFKDEQGRETTLRTRRIVHMARQHLAAIAWSLTPENWSGKIRIHSALNGTVVNDGVPRYRELNSQHLEPLETGSDDHSIYLRARTNQSRLEMSQAANLKAYESNGEDIPLRPEIISDPWGYIAQECTLECAEGKTLELEKTISLYTSRDRAISEPLLEARKEIRRADRFDTLLSTHQSAWNKLWDDCDIELSGDLEVQHVLRLHIFHLLQTASFNTIDLDVGIPARGWHGEAYRGHIFWDEMFIFPFLNMRIPELARSIKMYRYRRLREAKFAAQEEGYRGAMYPWQSGSNGREESQVVHLNPKSGEWVPDETHLQRHVNGSIVYNMWHYYQATDDMEFMSFYGAEVILNIALFWSSLTTYNPDRERYEIRGVVGPDEYHTRYPDSDELGLNNNAYTNIMAVWCIHKAMDVLELLEESRKEELREILEIDDEEYARWEDITSRMFVPFHRNGIISQFEGYEDLEEFPWDEYQEKYDDIQRLDRILGAEGKSPNGYKASKQADVVMLFFLFSAEELRNIFENLGYEFDPEIIPRNIDYYLQRTSHGSTLSRLVHSWVLSRSDRERSWDYFEEALMSDFKDIQGGTTPEGIHLGAMAGTVDLVQRCWTGLEIRNDVLWLNPMIPEELESMKLRIRYRGHWIALHLNHEKLLISFEEGWSRQVNIGIQDKIHIFEEGDTREFDLQG